MVGLCIYGFYGERLKTLKLIDKIGADGLALGDAAAALQLFKVVVSGLALLHSGANRFTSGEGVRTILPYIIEVIYYIASLVEEIFFALVGALEVGYFDNILSHGFSPFSNLRS